MGTIIHTLLSRTPIIKLLDGKKTLIGASLLVALKLIELMDQLAPLFPQYPVLADASKSLAQFLDGAKSALDYLGYGFIYVGLLHKAVKPPADQPK
jgi:hypothetical protein